ncbi:MAG: hypothetical protein SPI57_06345 [Prevotella sp.]|nr:hypothetical protein [Prevotella sp.]MCI5855097.1 hypothetical protein [Prevotella sp.]MDY6092790.1 hypothetical protein [Prevotella sp.]
MVSDSEEWRAAFFHTSTSASSTKSEKTTLTAMGDHSDWQWKANSQPFTNTVTTSISSTV